MKKFLSIINLLIIDVGEVLVDDKTFGVKIIFDACKIVNISKTFVVNRAF